jgi:hypothetical protein
VDTAKPLNLLRCVNHNIQRPRSEPENSTHGGGSLRRRTLSLHLHKQINITVRPRLTPRVTPKKNDAPGMEIIYDRSGDLLKQFRLCQWSVHTRIVGVLEFQGKELDYPLIFFPLASHTAAVLLK